MSDQKPKFVDTWYPKNFDPYSHFKNARPFNARKYDTLGQVKRALPSVEAIAEAMMGDMVKAGATVGTDKKPELDINCLSRARALSKLMTQDEELMVLISKGGDPNAPLSPEAKAYIKRKYGG